MSFSNAHGNFREAILIELTYTSGTVTWPASIAWKGGTPPALTVAKDVDHPVPHKRRHAVRAGCQPRGLTPC